MLIAHPSFNWMFYEEKYERLEINVKNDKQLKNTWNEIPFGVVLEKKNFGVAVYLLDIAMRKRHTSTSWRQYIAS